MTCKSIIPLFAILVFAAYGCDNSSSKNISTTEDLGHNKGTDPIMDSLINDTMPYYAGLAPNLGFSVSYVVFPEEKKKDKHNPFKPFKKPEQRINSLYFGQLYYPSSGQVKTPDDNTVWQIGSVTKTFTGYLLGWELANGGLTDDSTIAPFVDSYLKPNATKDTSNLDSLRKVTYRKLAAYNAGLRAANLGNVQDGKTSVQSFLNHLADDTAAFKYNVNTDISHYSNASIALLAYALTVRHYKLPASAKPDTLPQLYADYVTKRILKPWGMDSSFVALHKSDTVYTPESYKTNYKPYKTRYVNSWPANTGAGAMFCSTNDMVEYLQSNLRIYGKGQKNKDALKETREVLPLVTQDGAQTDVGLCWYRSGFLTGSYDHLWRYTKSGEVNGYKTEVAYVIDSGNGNRPIAGVVITGNWAGLDPSGLATYFLKQYVKATVPADKPVADAQ